MAVYILLFALVIFIATNYSNNNKMGYLALFVLFFISAFRGENVGTDTLHYLEIEDLSYRIENASYNIWARPEFIYVYFVQYFLEHDISLRFLLIFFSFIIVLFLWLTANRMKYSIPVMSLIFLLYFYLYSFNISRQIASISVLLYGYTFLIDMDKSKRKYFLLCVILAMLLHASSFLAIILWFIVPLKINRTVSLSVISILFLFNSVGPIPILQTFFEMMSSNFYSIKYGDDTSLFEKSLIGLATDFMNVASLLAAFLLQSKGTKTTPKDNLYLLGIIVTILTGNINSNVARISLCFSIFNVIYLTELFQKRMIKVSVNILFWFIVLFNSFFRLYDAAQGNGQIVPYYFSFNF